MEKELNVLKHFTNVSALFKILKGGLRFSDGRNWDDKNDYFDIQTYSSAIKRQVFTLCFCDGEGNVHHWNSLGRKKQNDLYAHIKCSIVLDKEKFIQYIDSLNNGYRHRHVIYCHNNEILQNHFQNIPFLKRKEFEVENEYRIICEGQPDTIIISNIKPIINKIIIGICPILEYEAIKSRLLSEFNIPSEKIGQNPLTDSAAWKNNIKKLNKTVKEK